MIVAKATLKPIILSALSVVVTGAMCSYSACWAQDDYDMYAQHTKDKRQIKKSLDELQDIKARINNASANAQQMQSQLSAQQQLKQFEVTVKECSYEFAPGVSVQCLGYNGQVPGPVFRANEGDPVRLIVHNKLSVPTSLYLQGIPLPHNVDGLPRSAAGLIAPGQTYTYQFIAPRAGTYWYHPQIIHGDQQDRGLFGALIVDPRDGTAAVDSDQVMVVSKWVGIPVAAGGASGAGTSSSTSAIKEHPSAAAGHMRMKALSQKDIPLPADAITYFLVNGKCAPLIPVLEVNPGSRVRLHVINTTSDALPLTLTGHLLQLFSDSANAPPPGDVAVIAPGTVSNVEFSCDNPGVWSLGSTLPYQNETQGSFPGGIARAVRYTGFSP
jgi:FtsP/CotA-like multicopper oxidase with cupredoxin domain